MIEIGFGIFCTNADGSLSTNHTFRLKNLSYDRVFDSFKNNLKDFFSLLELCKREKIEVFRLGSNFIPYASHREFQESWFLKLEPLIIEAGKEIRDKYKVRITMHPGQFVVLNSQTDKVIENSLRELNYHFWLLDSLGIGEEGVVIVHIGGVFMDKEKAIERFIKTVEKNSWLKRRLAIENDERFFNAYEVLKIAKTLQIPFIFDLFHHTLNPSDVEIKEIFDTWTGKGIPKVHLSSQGEGKRGIHGEYVKLDDYLKLMKLVEKSGTEKIHVMIEAKKKEKALKKLRESLN